MATAPIAGSEQRYYRITIADRHALNGAFGRVLASQVPYRTVARAFMRDKDRVEVYTNGPPAEPRDVYVNEAGLGLLKSLGFFGPGISDPEPTSELPPGPALGIGSWRYAC
jgi:hypothetical protein